MPSNNLFTNVITGTAIIASLATGGMAGLKVLANKNVEVNVPELLAVSPSPSPTTELNVKTSNDVAKDVVQADEPVGTIDPSSKPMTDDFPVASILPGTRFDDDDESDEDELESEDTNKREDHDDDENEDREDD